MSFPIERPRRLRRSEGLRNLVRETEVSVADLILPLFVTEGTGVRRPIARMPGVAQTSVDELVKDAREARELGIPAVILFGIPDTKDEIGSSGFAQNGVVQRAIRALKREIPDLLVITDVCLCEYTSHGHCGVLRDGEVDNDASLPLLARMAVSHAAAGADIVAPSDMMDGRVGAIRQALDESGFSSTSILAYSAKYASCFYDPFRDVAESAPKEGNRRGYQMDPANAREAVREVRLDIEEGADIVMVKPALSYLDIIARVRAEVEVPVCAYHVSGEYAMVVSAAEHGLVELERAMVEILTSIRRAGADLVITYFARDYARLARR
jgi:porphobilinogen synthase